jgi:O-antigen/teichoic acid export membrane protein
MLKRISNVFTILGITVGFGLLKNILLARELSKSDFGLFTLIMTLVGFIYPIVMLGQQNTIVRFFSKHSPSDYNWNKFIQKLYLISVPLVFLFIYISSFFFYFSLLAFFFLLIVILSSIAADLYTYLLRAIGQYESSIFLHRSIRIIFPLALIALLYLNKFYLNTIFLVFGAIYILHSLIIVLYTHNKTPYGTNQIPKSNYKEGLFILGSDFSLLVVISVDKLFIGRLVNFEELGVYFAIYSLMRIFELALHSIDYVLIPYSNKVENLNIKKMMIQVSGIGLLISGFYIIFGKLITHFVYSGKYDDGYYLILFFSLIGFLRLLYVVPSSIITGRLESKALKLTVFYNTIFMVLNIIIAFIFITIWQLKGAIISTSIIWLLRTSAAFAILFKFYKPHTFQHLPYLERVNNTLVE